MPSLVGSEMCIRDRVEAATTYSLVTADYSYFKVYYYDPPDAKRTGLQISYIITNSKSPKVEFIDIRKVNNITYAIQKISSDIKLNNGFFKITLRTPNYEKAVILDAVKLIAIEKNNNNITTIPVHFAFSHQSMRYVNQLIIKTDGVMFKLSNEDSLDLWFDSSKIPYANYQLFLFIAANIAPDI